MKRITKLIRRENFSNSFTHYRLTPFSMVSRTSVDASCTNVFVLTLEKPEIADDSESEDRLDWSNVGITNFCPTYCRIRFLYDTQFNGYCVCFFLLFWYRYFCMFRLNIHKTKWKRKEKRIRKYYKWTPLIRENCATAAAPKIKYIEVLCAGCHNMQAILRIPVDVFEVSAPRSADIDRIPMVPMPPPLPFVPFKPMPPGFSASIGIMPRSIDLARLLERPSLRLSVPKKSRFFRVRPRSESAFGSISDITLVFCWWPAIDDVGDRCCAWMLYPFDWWLIGDDCAIGSPGYTAEGKLM